MQNVCFLCTFQIGEIYEASYIKLYHLEMVIYQCVLHKKKELNFKSSEISSYGSRMVASSTGLLIYSTKKDHLKSGLFVDIMVPGAGLEPAREKISHRILSPMRLPIPPSRQNKMEAAPGFEPGLKDLQSSA